MVYPDTARLVSNITFFDSPSFIVEVGKDHVRRVSVSDGVSGAAVLATLLQDRSQERHFNFFESRAAYRRREKVGASVEAARREEQGRSQLAARPELAKRAKETTQCLLKPRPTGERFAVLSKEAPLNFG